MRAGAIFAEERQFANSHPENLLVIENRPDAIVIRAARNNLSLPQKARLIRYLAAEGYIPAVYQSFNQAAPKFHPRIDWIVDCSLAVPQPSPRQVLPRILFLVFSAGLLWLVLMSFAFLQAH
ncbi:MAG TPA: hypothetical protein VL361_07205 [Candidatus Limnocylindrales bacterium]|jgi:hypothetical protein|nr:hypothetical protein [Candidatus Limnocylindrales bacterium]